MIYLYLFLIGLAVGIMSTFFGVGGGALAVPALYTLFPSFPPEMVISSSLGMIFINAIINTIKFIRAGKRPQLSLCLPLGILTAAGAFIGSQIVFGLSPLMIKKGFGVVLILVALRTLLFKKSEGFTEQQWMAQLKKSSTIIKAALIGLCGGLLSGMTGLGGGAILVPLFMTVLQMPMRWIPVYSNIGMMFGSGLAVTTYALATPTRLLPPGMAQFSLGHVNYLVVFLIFLGATCSSGVGIKLSEKVPKHVTKRSFAALLLLLSVKILFF